MQPVHSDLGHRNTLPVNLQCSAVFFCSFHAVPGWAICTHCAQLHELSHPEIAYLLNQSIHHSAIGCTQADASLLSSIIMVQDLLIESQRPRSHPVHVVGVVRNPQTVKVANYMVKDLGQGTITAELLQPDELVSGLMAQVQHRSQWIAEPAYLRRSCFETAWLWLGLLSFAATW